MKEQPNLKTCLRTEQEAQAAMPLERLIVREGKTFRTNGEKVSFTLVSQPINISLKSVPEERRETYQMGINKLISRFSPPGAGANAYIAGSAVNNYLPVIYGRI